MEGSYDIIRKRWGSFFPYKSSQRRNEDVQLKELIREEHCVMMPAPYFFAFYDFELSKLLYVSPEVDKIYGIDNNTALTKEDGTFELILEDERPFVAKQTINILENFFQIGKSAFANRLFIHEYRVRTLFGTILHIMHQNEILTYNKDGLPKIEVARFVDMSWLLGEEKERIVKTYIYNRKTNEIDEYWEDKIFEKPAVKLTPREKEIQELVDHGLTSLEIAKKLELSVETVKTHRKNIKAKLPNWYEGKF